MCNNIIIMNQELVLKNGTINLIEILLLYHRELLLLYFIDNFDELYADNDSELMDFFNNIDKKDLSSAHDYGLSRCATTTAMLNYFLLNNTKSTRYNTNSKI